MSDTTTAPAPETTTAPVSTDNAPAPEGAKPEEKKTTEAVPYDRFKKVNDEKKALADENAQMKADQEKVRQAKMVEEGKTADLLKEEQGKVATLQVKADEWEKDQAVRREALNTELSAEDKAIADTLSVTDAEAFVKRITENNSPGTNQSRAGGGATEPEFTPGMSSEKLKAWNDYHTRK